MHPWRAGRRNRTPLPFRYGEILHFRQKCGHPIFVKIAVGPVKGRRPHGTHRWQGGKRNEAKRTSAHRTSMAEMIEQTLRTPNSEIQTRGRPRNEAIAPRTALALHGACHARYSRHRRRTGRRDADLRRPGSAVRPRRPRRLDAARPGHGRRRRPLDDRRRPRDLQRRPRARPERHVQRGVRAPISTASPASAATRRSGATPSPAPIRIARSSTTPRSTTAASCSGSSRSSSPKGRTDTCSPTGRAPRTPSCTRTTWS